MVGADFRVELNEVHLPMGVGFQENLLQMAANRVLRDLELPRRVYASVSRQDQTGQASLGRCELV